MLYGVMRFKFAFPLKILINIHILCVKLLILYVVLYITKTYVENIKAKFLVLIK
jgi:hypothetical protein